MVQLSGSGAARKNTNNTAIQLRKDLRKLLIEKNIPFRYDTDVKSKKTPQLLQRIAELTSIPEIIRNPINGSEMDNEGIALFKGLGYQLKDGHWTVPRDAKRIFTIITKQNIEVYTIPKKYLAKYKSGLVTYKVDGKTKSEAFRVVDRNSATNAVNTIIYSNYATYGDDAETTIMKIDIYKPYLSEGVYVYGAAYRGTRNCVIKALEAFTRKSKPEMHDKYRRGVFESDYLPIAKEFGVVLRVNVQGQLVKYNETRKKGICDLKYLNNHVIANYNGDERPIVKHQSFSDHEINTIFDSEPIDSILNVIKIKDEIICIETTKTKHQLSQQKFGEINIPINSDALTATTEFKRLFVEVNKLQRFPADNDAKAIARHGIKVLQSNFKEGSTIDLRGAYANFHKLPCYEGIPFDLAIQCNGNQTPEERQCILDNYLGFGLCSGWISYYDGRIETRWVPINLIKSRISKGYEVKVERWRLAFAKGDLDLSMFKGMPKGFWYRVIGSMSRVKRSESFATTDPILCKSVGGHDWRSINDVPVFLCEHKEELCSSYVHVSAYIQGYIEQMLEDKFDQLQADNVNWWAVYVDGISTTSDMTKYEDKYWASKPNKVFNMGDDQFDSSYTEASILDHDLLTQMEAERKHLNTADEEGYWEELGELDEKYMKLYEAKWKEINFVDIMVRGPGMHKIIDGPAGSGKSTKIKAVQRMFGCVILVPNNNQKAIFDGFYCETIDMHLTQQLNEKKHRIQFAIIDEYTMLDPSKLHRFDQALMFGNVAQLKIGEFLRYKAFDHHLLQKVYRCNLELETAALEGKKGNYSSFQQISIDDALKTGYTILSPTHRQIEAINSRALKMDQKKRGCLGEAPGNFVGHPIRFTKTDLKKDIYAGDMGWLVDGLCINERTQQSHKIPVGRDPHNSLVVYAYARTYHCTQGLQFDKIICCVAAMRDWDMLYTGATRCRKIEDVFVIKSMTS